MKATCPHCKRKFNLDAGYLPDHTDKTGDECPGANLPLWAARKETSDREQDA